MSTTNHGVNVYDPNTEALQPITVTDKARKHIEKELQKQSDAIGMQFGVKKSGCSGYMYVVELITTAAEDDYKFPVNEKIAIYVNKKSYPFIKGTKIDFVKKGLNEVFVYYNPNEDNNCGCGESFSINTDDATSNEAGNDIQSI